MPRFSLMLAAAATAALPVAFAAGPAGAATLHPVPAVGSPDASQATVQEVRHRRRHRSGGTIYFNFGFGTPYYGGSRYYYDPYYPRYYEPYYAPRYYEPVPAPRYYEPAPYTGSTGRCPAGQHFRYPIGCVPN